MGNVPSKCNADNCARALTGTPASQSASRVNTDCYNFQSRDYIFGTVTRTVASGSLSTTIGAMTTGTVPGYASKACTSNAYGAPSARFSSACACAGYPGGFYFGQATVTVVVPASTATL